MFITSARLSPEAAGFGFQFTDGPDVGDEDVSAPAVDYDNDEDFTNIETDEDPLGGETEADPIVDTAIETAPVAKEAKPEEFKPYEFKGKVNGEDVAQKFESKKDMDRVIARGIQAPRLFDALQAAKADMAKYKENSDWAEGLQSLANESPQDFFEHVVEEMIPIEKLAEWVYNKHTELTKLANMSPEQRNMVLQNKAAEKLLREQAHLEKQRKEAEAQADIARKEREITELTNWKSKEEKKWSDKLPEAARGKLDKYFRMVFLSAQANLAAGNKYGQAEMTADLAELLQPLIASQSPSQTKKEEMNQVANRNANAKDQLREMGRNSQQNERKPMSRDDVWKMASRKALSDANLVKRR